MFVSIRFECLSLLNFSPQTPVDFSEIFIGDFGRHWGKCSIAEVTVHNSCLHFPAHDYSVHDFITTTSVKVCTCWCQQLYLHLHLQRVVKMIAWKSTSLLWPPSIQSFHRLLHVHWGPAREFGKPDFSDRHSEMLYHWALKLPLLPSWMLLLNILDVEPLIFFLFKFNDYWLRFIPYILHFCDIQVII